MPQSLNCLVYHFKVLIKSQTNRVTLTPTAYNPSQEAGEGKRPPSKDPSSWGVDQVVWFIKDADPQALGPHAEAFRKHVRAEGTPHPHAYTLTQMIKTQRDSPACFFPPSPQIAFIK